MNLLAYRHLLLVSLLTPMICGRIFLAKTILQNTKLKGLPLSNAFSTLISTVCPGSSGQVQILWPTLLGLATFSSTCQRSFSLKRCTGSNFDLFPFDRVSDETIGEDLFSLPRVETAMANLYRIRRQLLDTITWHAVRATGTSFRLSLWPRTESLPYSSLSTHSLLTRLPPTLSLDPRFFVHNISSNYVWDWSESSGVVRILISVKTTIMNNDYLMPFLIKSLGNI